MASVPNPRLEWPDLVDRQPGGTDRMVAAGRLLSGVAHDFANVLTLIAGYSELLLSRVGNNESLRPELEQIREATARGARLTAQLLTFSRGQNAGVQPVDLNAVVTELARMLRLVIGEHVELVLELQPALHRVMADPGQMEQVVMNLVLNARDALPAGGHIRISTVEAEIDEAAARAQGCSPGRSVLLSVTDDGRGIAAEALAHIFEPFFTTKDEGKGTGLGLSTVHRIVEESGGVIRAQSAVGKGATFTVCLPCANGTAGSALPRGAGPALMADAGTRAGAQRREGETLLLVEDEDDVRRLLSLVLRKRGYHVLEASGGQEALRVFEEHAHEIQLVLTDMVMPGITGRQLGEMLSQIRPGLPMVYMSGYTDEVLVRTGALRPGMSFLQKPLRPDVLAAKVREALDAAETPSWN